jgi:hypothetical protein
MEKNSPFKVDPGTATVLAPAALSAAGSIIGGIGSVVGGKRQRRAARRAAARARAERAKQQAALEKEKQAYRDLKFSNPYEGLQNPFAGLENTYEDLPVATAAAEFQMQRADQQRTDLLQSLRAAAGGSGIAALAQTLANQGQLQARQVSADIQRQEAANAMAAARGADRVQTLERQGAFTAERLRRQGAAMVTQAEAARQATLLGIQFGSAAGANKAYQRSLYNQQMANASANQMMISGITGMAKGLAGMDFSGGNTSTSGSNVTSNFPDPSTALNLPGANEQSIQSYTYNFGNTPPSLPNYNVPTTGSGLSAFQQAFAAARAEQGPGGQFPFEGLQYSTNIAGEGSNAVDDYQDYGRFGHTNPSFRLY